MKTMDKKPTIPELQQRNKKLHVANEKLRKENEVLTRTVAELYEDLDIARNDIRNYVTSTSWKITKPLRVIRSLFK